MSASWLNLLGLARRAGKLAPGENQVSLAMRREQAAMLIIAEDAGASVYRKYHLWAQDLEVPLVTIGTKASLGHAIGMGPHAVLAILDKDFGARILDEMRTSSGGIILDRKRERQDPGVRTGERAETRQSPANRPASPTQSRKHQKSHEHGRAGSGQNGAGHHGGKASPGTQTGAQTGPQTGRSAPRGRSSGNSAASGRTASAAKQRNTKPRPKR